MAKIDKSRPLKVKVKNNQVTITFNSESWTDAYSKLAEFLGGSAGSADTPVAEHVMRAFELLFKDCASPKDDFERFMDMMNAMSNDIDHETGEIPSPSV